MNSALYGRDFYAWVSERAALLSSGRLDDADVAHLTEEIERMGRSEKRELVNRLAVLPAHLLKWQYQPLRMDSSWNRMIREQRIRIAHHLEDNPSLKAVLPDAIGQGFELALIARWMKRPFRNPPFPASFPYSFEQIMDPDFWPGCSGCAERLPCDKG